MDKREWKRESIDTSVWLKFETAAGIRDPHVARLKWSICARFQSELSTMKNFTTTFIECSSNVRISIIKEHVRSDTHKSAMILYKKSASSVPTEYSSIAHTFAQSSMDWVIIVRLQLFRTVVVSHTSTFISFVLSLVFHKSMCMA